MELRESDDYRYQVTIVCSSHERFNKQASYKKGRRGFSMNHQVKRDAKSYAVKLEQYYLELQDEVIVSPSTNLEVEALNKMLIGCLSLPTPQRESEFLSCILRNRKAPFAEESMLDARARGGTAKGAALQPAGV